MRCWTAPVSRCTRGGTLGAGEGDCHVPSNAPLRLHLAIPQAGRCRQSLLPTGENTHQAGKAKITFSVASLPCPALTALADGLRVSPNPPREARLPLAQQLFFWGNAGFGPAIYSQHNQGGRLPAAQGPGQPLAPRSPKGSGVTVPVSRPHLRAARDLPSPGSTGSRLGPGELSKGHSDT